MLYVWTKNYPQVVGTCSGHHGQLISQNCVPTKIRAEPPPPLINTLTCFQEKLCGLLNNFWCDGSFDIKFDTVNLNSLSQNFLK